MIKIVQPFLKKNAILFDKEELIFQIQSHPSYPSLHAITGVLDHFNIENIAAQVPVEKETLISLPNTFIAQIHDKKRHELVFVERKKSNIYIFGTDGEQKLSEEDFLKIFTGIILAVEKGENTNTEKTIFS